MQSNQSPATEIPLNQPPATEPPPGYQGPGYSTPGYPTPGYPTPGYPGPGYPGPGYPGPGYPAAQVQAGIPQYTSGFPQYAPPSTFPVQPNAGLLGHAVAYGAVPIQGQPNPVIWMPTPPAPPKCPPGLEYLSQERILAELLGGLDLAVTKRVAKFTIRALRVRDKLIEDNVVSCKGDDLL